MSTIEQNRTVQEKVEIQNGYERNFDINALHKKGNMIDTYISKLRE